MQNQSELPFGKSALILIALVSCTQILLGLYLILGTQNSTEDKEKTATNTQYKKIAFALKNEGM